MNYRQSSNSIFDQSSKYGEINGNGVLIARKSCTKTPKNRGSYMDRTPCMTVNLGGMSVYV